MMHAVVSTSIQPAAAAHNIVLNPIMTLEGHDKYIRSISYFPDGRRMISGSWDKTAWQWDLQVGKEIEEARNVCERGIWAVAVSRDGRWVITGGGGLGHGELKVIEVETGIVKQFEGHSKGISCIDISADSKFLASGSWDRTTRIWNLRTGELVAGPFESIDWVGGVRFSSDSKKIAVKSEAGKCLEVWDVHTETLDVRIGEFGEMPFTSAPVFWTHRNKTIVAAFTFTFDDATTIYEFDALTLETVGAPFEAHTKIVRGLALSFDDTLLASAADDNTIKVWAFESRQLLASFNARTPMTLILSPDSSQLAYTTGRKIYICNTPPDILASVRCALEARDAASSDKNSRLDRLLNSHATRHPPAVRRHQATSPVISFNRPYKPPPEIRPAKEESLRCSNGAMQFLQQHLSFRKSAPNHEPPVVEVTAGRKFTRIAAAKVPEYIKVDDTRRPSKQQLSVSQDMTRDHSLSESSDVDSLPDVHWCKAFLCYYSCWSRGRLRMPPRWRLEKVDPPH